MSLKGIKVSGRVVEGTVVDVPATVTCSEPKINLLVGEKKLTCQSDGNWSAVPECQKCGVGKVVNDDETECGTLFEQYFVRINRSSW